MCWMQLLVTAFLAILFLQSGLDKVFDRDGNLAFLREHFENSPIGGQVELMLTVVTVFEVLTGVLCGLGALAILLWGGTSFASMGAVLSGVTIVMLFFGQRVAKDYAGAATLVPYFLLSLAAIHLLHA
jgi:uncharacterized membrane protein YphA (DoxX/SURF4 family)